MRKVAILAAHFVPSNLAAVHRARLWSLHLREFGWEPIIVTTDSEYYEEQTEPELLAMFPKDIEVIRTRAFPTRPVRLVGDVGVRGLAWHYQALLKLKRERNIDFLHITIPSNFSAVLGRILHRKTGLPYGIDYIDPWVHEFPGSRRPFTKAWASARLAEILEPWAVRQASLITGINRAYYQGMLDRNPGVSQRAALGAMPYGGSEGDHEYVRSHPRPARLFAAHRGKFNFIYAGAMLPHAFVVLERFLAALGQLRRRRPRLAEEFHLSFVGTGKAPGDPKGFNVQPYIDRYGVADCASEYPQRLPYLDVLTHLHASSGVLVLGSTEPHYSPSKIFQSVMSRRPVFALLHEESTAVPILLKANAGEVMTLTGKCLPEITQLEQMLERFIYFNPYSEGDVQWRVLEEYSARASAGALAHGLNQAMAGLHKGIQRRSIPISSTRS